MSSPIREDRIRVVRTLVYEGPRSWVERTLDAGYIKGKHLFSSTEKGDQRYIESIVGPQEVVVPAMETNAS